MRSRRKGSTSLVTTAPTRRQKPARRTGDTLASGGLESGLPTSSRIQRIVAGLPHEMDEDVFQRRLRLIPADRRAAAMRLDGLQERIAVGAADVQCRTKRGSSGDAGSALQVDRQSIGPGTRCHEADQAGRLDDL